MLSMMKMVVVMITVVMMMTTDFLGLDEKDLNGVCHVQ